MHKAEFVEGNEMPKDLWDVEMQTDHLIPVKRLNLLIVNNPPTKPHQNKTRTCRIVDLAVLMDKS